MKIKANGIAINYQTDGPDGAPWLIFSNSLATNLTMWDDQARELKHAYRVLRYDQRGHGGTEATAGRYSFELLMADVIALMDALAIKTAHFAGLSMGGATALGLAETHPDRLDRVIVCDTPCQSTPASAQQWEERIVIAEKQGIDALVEPTVGRWFPPEVLKANPPHLDKVRRMIRTTPVERVHRLRRGARRPRLRLSGCNGEAAGSVHGRREGRGDAGRYAQAQRGPAGLALRRVSRRRAHLQHG